MPGDARERRLEAGARRLGVAQPAEIRIGSTGGAGPHRGDEAVAHLSGGFDVAAGVAAIEHPAQLRDDCSTLLSVVVTPAHATSVRWSFNSTWPAPVTSAVSSDI